MSVLFAKDMTEVKDSQRIALCFLILLDDDDKHFADKKYVLLKSFSRKILLLPS